MTWGTELIMPDVALQHESHLQYSLMVHACKSSEEACTGGSVQVGYLRPCGPLLLIGHVIQTPRHSIPRAYRPPHRHSVPVELLHI